METKKMAAAIAAVYAHISSQEAVMAAGAQAESDASAPEVQPPSQVRPYNTWGIAGRQNLMQANTMMQMRMFR